MYISILQALIDVKSRLFMKDIQYSRRKVYLHTFKVTMTPKCVIYEACDI